MEADLYLFRPWLMANGISTTTGYRLVRDGALRLTKIRKRSYVARTEATRFIKSIQST